MSDNGTALARSPLYGLYNFERARSVGVPALRGPVAG
jgi:hypothetical protein